MWKHNRRDNMYLLLFVLLGCITIGYAILSTNLAISGTGKLSKATWDIHFENLNVSTGSVAAMSPATITSTTSVTYNVTLNKPGDFYEFTVDVKNDGTIDGMIQTVSSKLNNVEITSLPNCLYYSVTYIDNLPIVANQQLDVGEKETYKVRLAFKDDVNPEDLPSSEQTYSLNFSVTYVQKNDDAVPVVEPPSDFSSDSWDTIRRSLSNGTFCSDYAVGDVKTISVANDTIDYGSHDIRIANCSRPAVCDNEGFSQTACGIVLEFSDIVSSRHINDIGYNIGGWAGEKHFVRKFINDTIYYSLPVSLKNLIIDTYVVSGHGSSDSDNFITTDKLYLLSISEIFGYMPAYDTATNSTRQLDIHVQDFSHVAKGSSYWLRNALANNSSFYSYINISGSYQALSPGNGFGVSPAFRIG